MTEKLVPGRGESLAEPFGNLECPPWLYLPTDDYDSGLVAAQDVVSRMSWQEKEEAMRQIAETFKKKRSKQ